VEHGGEDMNPTDRLLRAMPLAENGLPRPVSLAELNTLAVEHADLRDGDRWERWTYSASLNVLTIPAYGPGATYEVDLDRCRSDLEAWRWVSHIAGKVWATDADVGALLRALKCWLNENATPRSDP
jgi:hypothetical protein